MAKRGRPRLHPPVFRFNRHPSHVRRGDSLSRDDREYLQSYWAAPLDWRKTFFLCRWDGHLDRRHPRPFTAAEALDWKRFVEDKAPDRSLNR